MRPSACLSVTCGLMLAYAPQHCFQSCHLQAVLASCFEVSHAESVVCDRTCVRNITHVLGPAVMAAGHLVGTVHATIQQVCDLVDSLDGHVAHGTCTCTQTLMLALFALSDGSAMNARPHLSSWPCHLCPQCTSLVHPRAGRPQSLLRMRRCPHNTFRTRRRSTAHPTGPARRKHRCRPRTRTGLVHRQTRPRHLQKFVVGSALLCSRPFH